MMSRKVFLSLGIWIIAITSANAGLGKKVIIQGKIVPDHLDSRLVTILDSHGQIIYLPRKYLSKKTNQNIVAGKPVSIKMGFQDFKALRIEASRR